MPLQYSDFAGTWLLTPNTSAANYKNRNNLNVNSGGVHFVLPAGGNMAVLNGTHDAGFGAGKYQATFGGSIAPPDRGTLQFVRSSGEGRLTITNVTPTRFEGQLLSTDQGSADLSFGRTPCLRGRRNETVTRLFFRK